MREPIVKSDNFLESEVSKLEERLIFKVNKESKSYNMEKNPEIKANGERTWKSRIKVKNSIAITPAIYTTEYAEESIQTNANLPA